MALHKYIHVKASMPMTASRLVSGPALPFVKASAHMHSMSPIGSLDCNTICSGCCRMPYSAMLSPGAATSLVNNALEWIQQGVLDDLVSSLSTPTQQDARQLSALMSVLAAVLKFLDAHVHARQVRLLFPWALLHAYYIRQASVDTAVQLWARVLVLLHSLQSGCYSVTHNHGCADCCTQWCGKHSILNSSHSMLN